MFSRALILCALIAVLLSLTIEGTAQVTCTPVFIKEFTGSGLLEPLAAKALPDGTVLVAGRASKGSASAFDGYISRVQNDGTIMWSFLIGGPADDEVMGIILLADGSAMLYGSTKSFGHPEGKGWLVHIDLSGAILWSGQMGSSSTSTDRIKAVQQYPDGDLIGTLNVNDSSAASDPVVFKIGLDGTIRWTTRFDNGSDDSFTTLAVSGDTVYAGGYYTVAGATLAVLTEIKATTGTHFQSVNVNNGDASFNEQITGLEIYNSTISYGVYLNKGNSGYSNNNEIVLVQTDLAGNPRHVSLAQDYFGVAPLKAVRTPDSGFYVLRMDYNGGWIGGPAINKINIYGDMEWGFYLGGTDDYWRFRTFDVTPDGGCLAAGYYGVFLPGGVIGDKMRLIKMTSKGEIGSCDLPSESFYTYPATINQPVFSWASQPSFSPLSTTLSPSTISVPLTTTSSCASQVCVDHTPIPTGCSKTSNIQYTSARSTVLRDILSSPDGGRIAVGHMQTPPGNAGLSDFYGLVTKYQSNGDIAWARNYRVPGQNWLFRRILRTADGNFLVIGVDYYDYDHSGYADMVMLKLDNNGNVLWTRLFSDLYTEPADVVATPDNGFVVALVHNYGSGSGQYCSVARFDADGVMVWRTRVDQRDVPIYRAIACSQDAVFVAYDPYVYNYDLFGVDRLDLASGKLVYSKRFSVGSGTSVEVNGLFTQKDSVYAFLYRYTSGATTTVQNLMVGLDQQGGMFRALQLGTDPVNPSPPFSYGHLDAVTPSVAMTPDQDFWLANQVTVSGTKCLSITRLKADGTVESSKLHSSLGSYLPFNVRSQGKGLAVVGGASAIHTGSPYFTNAFTLKLDSTGQLQSGAAAGCLATDRPFVVTPCTTCSPVDNFIPSTPTVYQPVITSPSPEVQRNDLSAVLYCFQPGSCDIINMKQKGKVCAPKDTLVCYLDRSGNCSAAASWNYDPAFFKPGLVTGDSIQLIAQKAGATTVNAQVEGYCSFSTQTEAANIVFSSTTGLGLPADTVICSDGPITLQATSGFDSYLWSDNSIASSLQVSTPGPYSLVATDQCGHPKDASVQVIDANAAFHVTQDTVRCNQDVDPLQATAGYFNYQWSPAYGLQPDGNKALASPDLTTRYTVSAQRSLGCTVKATVLVTALSSPAIRLGNDTSLCKGDSLVLDASPDFHNYQWSTGETMEKIFVSKPGTYSISAQFANGCTSLDTFRLDLYEPKPVLDKNPVYCAASDRILIPGDFASYLWNDGSTGSSINVSGTGDYWVRVTDQHGCTAADTVHILSQALPPKEFLPTDTTICQYGDLILTTPQRYKSYSWSDLSTSPALTVHKPGTYWVTVTDNNGCIGTDSVLITQKYCMVGVFVPSAFTPNGDGHNDRIRPMVYGNIRLLDFAILGRWGELLFETQIPTEGWDGKIKGSLAPAGTYVWYCRFQPDGQPIQMEKGTVVLIR